MIIYKGAVTATAGLFVRSTPNGAIIGKLAVGTSVEGRGELSLVGSYNWMELTSPMVGYVASEFVSYTKEVISDPVPAEFPNEVYLSLTPTGEHKKYLLAG